MSRTCRVVPAILTDDPQALAKMVRQAETFADFVQVDIMDGRFVPSRSVVCRDVAVLEPKLRWEVHMMVRQPEEQLHCFAMAGAEKIVFHFEAASCPLRIIKLIRHLGVKVGLAVNPETPLTTTLSLADSVDSVLFLTVHPGFYGAEFLPEVLDKVVELRDRKPNLEIGVDGGIKKGNIDEVARTGLDFICVGSAILMQPDPAAAHRHLQSLADQATRSKKH
ncbi:MAG: ribulose-phosphate 3-epimerase [Dehalococcoidia bacterium]|nr:ribulose-phosphate 3-epimerase [Dehalococcoidia bacterium]